MSSFERPVEFRPEIDSLYLFPCLLAEITSYEEFNGVVHKTVLNREKNDVPLRIRTRFLSFISDRALLTIFVYYFLEFQ